MRCLRGALLLCAAVLIISGAGRTQPRPHPFTVAAASDLQNAFPEIGRQFEAASGRKVVFSFGATGNLAKQIENGAPFDVFAAANEQFVDDLDRKGLLAPGSKRLYAIGRLVLASNRRAGPPVRELKGLLDPRVKRVAIANPAHAPYGAAAREALKRAGVWERLQPKLVLGENIRQTLQFIQTGNAEAGIVSHSVAGVPEVTYTPISERLHEPLRQALAIVKRTPNGDAARQFARFVAGPRGRAVLVRHGFHVPEAPVSKRDKR
jgi:molybdate transport system substrate-binding protein